MYVYIYIYIYNGIEDLDHVPDLRLGLLQGAEPVTRNPKPLKHSAARLVIIIIIILMLMIIMIIFVVIIITFITTTIIRSAHYTSDLHDLRAWPAARSRCSLLGSTRCHYRSRCSSSWESTALLVCSNFQINKTKIGVDRFPVDFSPLSAGFRTLFRNT